ncbi:3'-5' exonuclease [Leadbetterella byssophila]|uniref:3'-5' exonuclease n=1 Tax=Leadbetterella byssophila TaxID=316068 RepID=UPI0039A34555
MKNILFLDIETVSLTEDFNDLPERLQEHWQKKVQHLKRAEPVEDVYVERAAIFAEFGKIICIGVGGETSGALKVSCLYHEDERTLLLQFKELIERHPAGKRLILCAHNGKEFDFPYLCRRMIIHGIPLPDVLQMSGKKPWEIPHLDTLEMWKFGDYKHFTSLDLLAAVLGIEGSKGSLDGSKVNAAYYLEDRITDIIHYCMEDVVVLSQVFRRLRGQTLYTEIIRNPSPEKN